MKKLIAFFTLIPALSFAGPIEEMVNALGNGNLSPAVRCEAESESCRDLVGSICAPKNSQSILNEVARNINRRFPPLREQRPALRHRRLVSLPAIAAAEIEIYNRSPASREEISAFFEVVRNQLKELVRTNPLIPEARRGEMLQKLTDVRMYLSAADFVGAESTRRQQQRPERGIEDNTDRAFRDYAAKCDDNGLEVNAVNNGAIAICPGLIGSLLNRVHSKDELLTALSFTFGHELSHSIGPQDFPEVYAQLGNCYNSISGNTQFWNGDGSVQAGEKGYAASKEESSSPVNKADVPYPKSEETTADWWGSQILARRISSQNIVGSDVLRTIGNATDDLCDATAGGSYPSGHDRIGLTLIRNPEINRRIGCSEQPRENLQTCQLGGQTR